MVGLAGDLDVATTPQLTSYLREQTSTGPAHLVLDLAEVQFLASAGISLILTAMNNADGTNGSAHLTGVTENRVVARVLDRCGLLPASTSTRASTICSATGPRLIPPTAAPELHRFSVRRLQTAAARAGDSCRPGS